jgi:hypothetical protein
MEDRAIERDGRCDLVLRDDLGDKGVDRRHFERDAGSKAQGQHDDVPDLNASGVNQEPENKREEYLDYLSPN